MRALCAKLRGVEDVRSGSLNAFGSLFPAVALALAALAPYPVEGQGLDSRTPNLSGGWVGTSTESARFNFNHRFFLVGGDPGERKVVNSPTMLLGFPLPGGLLLAGQYASNSLVVSNKFNEWEGLLRWAPPILQEPVGFAVTAAYNGAAESVDGELSLRLPVRFPESMPGDSIQVLGAFRGFSDALGSGEMGWFVGGGVLFHMTPTLALALDGGRMESDGLDLLEEDGTEVKTLWGAGIQMRLEGTPHTVSLQATNARTGTLQGSSAGFSETVWGFEFTVPITYARILP